MNAKSLVLLILVSMSVILSPLIVRQATMNTSKSVLIKGKEAVQHKEGTKYLIFTNGQVYENQDSFWDWKFNSSDVYNDLDPGKCYDIKSNMFRLPFFSWYENIVSATPSTCPDSKS